MHFVWPSVNYACVDSTEVKTFYVTISDSRLARYILFVLIDNEMVLGGCCGDCMLCIPIADPPD